MLFHSLWKVFLLLIPEEIQEKIKIHGKLNLTKHLLPFINLDSIPAYLGGQLNGYDCPSAEKVDFASSKLDKYCKDRVLPFGADRNKKDFF